MYEEMEIGENEKFEQEFLKSIEKFRNPEKGVDGDVVMAALLLEKTPATPERDWLLSNLYNRQIRPDQGVDADTIMSRVKFVDALTGDKISVQIGQRKRKNVTRESNTR